MYKFNFLINIQICENFKPSTANTIFSTSQRLFLYVTVNCDKICLGLPSCIILISQATGRRQE